ncbi:MAG: hypothetical protein K6T87_11600 [Roseiflexus sp.]|uniref:hypothetical protein n=1 Tax=Roseiflexus sp. TaxID=2562120 RepID=UPI0025D741B9|nr:hypothetical protein [Roseiflexus sp.]MCL6541203.1 hypothetical protein [Roseiflexus sp.]
MPDHLRPSAVPRRRATLLALLLLALAALGAAATGVARADGSDAPPGGWVKANAIVGSYCVPSGPGRSDCFSRVVRAEGLFEYVPRRIPVAASTSKQSPSSPPVVIDRPPCSVNGVFITYPPGNWHYGQRWVKDVSWTYTIEPGYEGVPPEYRRYRVTITTQWRATAGPTYAFYATEGCETLLTRIPTATPTGGGNGTPTVPPGTGVTVTPTIPDIPLRTPTPTPPPTATATATPPVCIPSPIDPVPLTLFAGTTNHYNNNGQPFTPYSGRYSGADGSRYYGRAEWGQMIFGDLTSLDAMAQDRTLWTRVPANAVVEARYHFEQAHSMFDASDVSRSRNAMVILQDLGADMRPGGGDDRLLAFLAMGDENLLDNPANRRLKVQGTYLDSWPRLNLPGRPSGWQALRAPGVQVWSNAFFSWQGNNDSGFVWRSTRGYRFASKMTSSLG